MLGHITVNYNKVDNNRSTWMSNVDRKGNLNSCNSTPFGCKLVPYLLYRSLIKLLVLGFPKKQTIMFIIFKISYLKIIKGVIS